MTKRLICIAAFALLVPACGGTAGQTVTIDLKVTGDRMTPDHPKAKKGDTMKITITTDKDEEIHLHGFDVPFEAKANTPLTKEIKADRTGSFEIEIEDSSTHLGELEVDPS